MTTNRPLKVFLCHSSADKPAVRELYKKLRAEPWIQPWLDEEELFPGMDWNLEIEKAIEATDVILVCLSNNSITKEGYVQREIRIALDYADYKPEGTLFIIPVRLEECTPPKRLSRWQYADYFEGQRERGFQRVLGSLKIYADSFHVNSSSSEVVAFKKKDVILPKFYRREVHLEYKINADAKIVYDYLLQLYTGVAFFIEAFNSIYQVDTIVAFTPNGHDIFQWGFVASGTKTTPQHRYTTVAGIKMTPDPVIEQMPEMFLISISQGQKGVSILSFDTDVQHAHMFTTGLVRDLRKVFLVELLNPSQHVHMLNEEQVEEAKKTSAELSAQKIEDEVSLNKKIATEDNKNISKNVKNEIQNPPIPQGRRESLYTASIVKDNNIFVSYSWLARFVIGSVFGLVIDAFILFIDLLFDSALLSFEDFDSLLLLVLVVVGCGVAGSIVYPHKSSLALLGLGFSVIGMLFLSMSGASQSSVDSFVGFITVGLVYGFPAGALVSRILLWTKVIH